MKRSSWLTILSLVGLAALLGWLTFFTGRVECTVCMEFSGGRNCAVAAAEDEESAFSSARSTACGLLARGVRDSFACDAAPAATRSCR